MKSDDYLLVLHGVASTFILVLKSPCILLCLALWKSSFTVYYCEVLWKSPCESKISQGIVSFYCAVVCVLCCVCCVVRECIVLSILAVCLSIDPLSVSILDVCVCSSLDPFEVSILVPDECVAAVSCFNLIAT
jgi:hypothetical protein